MASTPGTIYWDGSASTDCTAAANWTVGTATEHTTPTAGDEVIFDGRPDQTYAATTVCAVGDTGGVAYDSIHVKAGHTGTIGASGAPFHTEAQKIIIEGSGTYYFEASAADAVTDADIPLVIVNNPNATVYLTSNVNSAAWCAEFLTIEIIAGTVYIGNNGTADVDTAVQYLRIDPRNSTAGNAIVYIKVNCERYKATTYKMSLFMENGTVTSDSAATLIDMSGGVFNFGTALATAEADLNITTLRMRGSSIFYWYPDDDGDPTITTTWLYGGIFDASGTTNNHQDKTITTAYIFKGASAKLNNSMGNITVTTLENYGGVVDVDTGARVAVTYNPSA